MTEAGLLSTEAAALLRQAITDHETILIVGGTGTGKTTFLNILLTELATLCPQDRIGILEDTPELSPCSPDTFRAWNTGHPGGLATLHANGCHEALIRLSTLVQRAGVPPQPELIAATVSLLVHLIGTSRATRRVSASAAA